MLEIWVKMDGSLSQYEISSLGRVRRRININHAWRGKNYHYFKAIHSNGGLRVQLGPVKKSIHRLVYNYFVGDLSDGLVIAHLDGNYVNNSPENLLQTTQLENINHKKLHGTWQAGPSHPRAKKSHSYSLAEKVRQLLAGADTTESGRLRRGQTISIAKSLGVSVDFVRDIRNKGAWADKGGLC